MRSVSILGSLLVATIAVPAAAHGPSDEISLCTSKVEFTRSCCNNPATCMTEEQGRLQAELDTKMESMTGNSNNPNTATVHDKVRELQNTNSIAILQTKINTAARDNCLKAADSCATVCKVVNPDAAAECEQAKKNLSILNHQLEKIPRLSPQELHELMDVEENTKALPPQNNVIPDHN